MSVCGKENPLGDKCTLEEGHEGVCGSPFPGSKLEKSLDKREEAPEAPEAPELEKTKRYQVTRTKLDNTVIGRILFTGKSSQYSLHVMDKAEHIVNLSGLHSAEVIDCEPDTTTLVLKFPGIEDTVVNFTIFESDLPEVYTYATREGALRAATIEAYDTIAKLFA